MPCQIYIGAADAGGIIYLPDGLFHPTHGTIEDRAGRGSPPIPGAGHVGLRIGSPRSGPGLVSDRHPRHGTRQRGTISRVEVERTTHQDIAHQLRFGAPAALFSNHDPAHDRVEGTISFQAGNRLKLTLRTDELPEWVRTGKLGIDLLFDDNSYSEMFWRPAAGFHPGSKAGRRKTHSHTHGGGGARLSGCRSSSTGRRRRRIKYLPAIGRGADTRRRRPGDRSRTARYR